MPKTSPAESDKKRGTLFVRNKLITKTGGPAEKKNRIYVAK
jgi:hypothetical protein